MSNVAVGGRVFNIIGIREITRRFRRVSSTLNSIPLMSEIGEMVVARIQDRTMRGVDVNESAFRSYSPKYALFRQAHGRPVDKVDLNFTGTMMSAMTHEESRHETRIFFQNITDPSGVSVPVKAFFLNETREFFGMSEADRVMALSIVDRFIERAARTSGRRRR